MFSSMISLGNLGYMQKTESILYNCISLIHSYWLADRHRHTQARTHKHAHAHTHTHAHTQTQVHIHTHMHTHTNTSTHIHTHTQTQVHIHTHRRTDTYPYQQNKYDNTMLYSQHIPMASYSLQSKKNCPMKFDH